MLDFIDIGSSKGGSVKYGKQRFGTGYGIDIDKQKVSIAKQQGYDVRWMDIVDVKDSARWVTCLHVIEHLSGREKATEMIREMLRIATEGVYITFPYFDADAYLYHLGLKFFWSDWVGHPYHCTSLELHNILTGLGCDFKIEYFGPINHTNNKAIIPLNAPIDSLTYDAETMDAKKMQGLQTIYRELRCTISL